MKLYTADFETSTDKWLNVEETARVWAYAISEIGNEENFKYGTTIEDFMSVVLDGSNATYFFHNLKYDGEYIFNYLLNHNFSCIKDKKERKDKSFICLITEMGVFYSIEVYLQLKPKLIKVKFLDSLKIFNMSVEQIAKSFNLKENKLKIDYDEIRPINHELTEEEIEYIHNDVTIVSKALSVMFNMGHKKMTIASNAMSDYKSINKNFNHYFPELTFEVDNEIRSSYRGGFTYLNPLYKNKVTKSGIVFDVNSLYPSVMMNMELPYGVPIPFIGCYKYDKKYPLYVIKLTCSFDIKNGHIPSIQIKKNPYYKSNEYIESTNGELVTITITSVDFLLMQAQYNIKVFKYWGGYKFKSVKGLFSEYINKWINTKIQSKKDNNSGLYTISKLFLNSLYGKFGLNPRVRGKYPYLEDNVVKYKFYPEEFKSTIYIPMATFITAYARYKTITTSQKIKDASIKQLGFDAYVYSDTDSIHCLFDDDKILKNIIEIDDFKLGAWKWESSFKKGKYLRQKTYIEEEKNTLKICCAGLPKKCYDDVTFENFKVGFVSSQKLNFCHVSGGVVLKETEFTIKEDDL